MLAEGIEHLPLEKDRRAAIDERVQEHHAHLLEKVAFLCERRLGRCRRGRNGGAGAMGLRVHQIRRQIVDHGEEDHIQRLLLVVLVKQVVHVRDAHFGWEAGIDGAALGARFVKFLGGKVGVDQVLRRNPQRLKVGAEHRVGRVLVQHARNADAQAGAALHGRHARLLSARSTRIAAARPKRPAA